ncbi:MAG: hypothetical protein ACRD2O_12895 [Terriglobia bacterium]
MRTVAVHHEKVNTIYRNPVNAGLVGKADDWTGSSVGDYTASVFAPAGADRLLAVDRGCHTRAAVWHVCGSSNTTVIPAKAGIHASAALVATAKAFLAVGS